MDEINRRLDECKMALEEKVLEIDKSKAEIIKYECRSERLAGQCEL